MLRIRFPVSTTRFALKGGEYNYQDVSRQIDSLIETAHSFDAMTIAKKMKEIVPEFVSNNSVYSVLDKKA